MTRLSMNQLSVIEAVELLNDETISITQKLSYLHDWEWSLAEVVELALIAADEKEKIAKIG